MTTNGWIKLHRQSLDSIVFSDPWLWQLFCWCLLKANHEPLPWKKQIIPRGSFATGRMSAAEQLQVAPSKFSRGIEKLISLEMISKESNNRFTTIRIENYEEYQKRDVETGQPAGQPADTNKKDKNSKKRFAPPTLDEVSDYVKEYTASHAAAQAKADPAERKPRWPVRQFDAQRFVDHYEANGWVVGKNKMKCWRAAVRNWGSRDFQSKSAGHDQPQGDTIADMNRREGALLKRQAEQRRVAREKMEAAQ